MRRAGQQAPQPNRRLNAVVDKPFGERDVVSREAKSRVNSMAELSSARVNSLFGGGITVLTIRRATIRRATVLVFCILGVPILIRGQDPAAEKPLTNFRPSKDFFNVKNRGVVENGYRGSCMGTVEMAVSYFDSLPADASGASRMAALGEEIKTARGDKIGDAFLLKINAYAQNHARNADETNPQTGTALADLLYADIKRTGKPQVLGLDLRDVGLGAGRHAVVIYDARKVGSNITFKVGNPDDPTNEGLSFSYDAKTKKWSSSGFSGNQYSDGGFTPVFIRWDDKQKRVGPIPKDKYLALVEGVKQARLRNGLSAEDIGAKLLLSQDAPFRKADRSTGNELDKLAGTETASKPNLGLVETSWTGYYGTTFRFKKDGVFIVEWKTKDPKVTVHAGTWGEKDGKAWAKFRSDVTYPTLTIKSTYDITISSVEGGKAKVSWTVVSEGGIDGGPAPFNGEFLKK